MKAALEKIKDKQMWSLANVEASAALKSIDATRNTSLYKAEALIRADPKLMGRTAKKKRATGRGIYVENLRAYLQKDRYDPKGTFEGEFQHLKLP